MSGAVLPPNEAERLAALLDYGILDTPPEQAFQDLVTIAATLCDVPMSSVTLIDRDRQWVKAALGIPGDECRREDSFCTHAILTPDALMVVPDAAQDPRFRDSPFVTGEAGVRFYAGAPLVTPGGHALGALCVMDRRPRTLSQRQLEALEGLARQTVAQIELRKAYAQLRHHASERVWYERQIELAHRRLAEENAQLSHASLTDELTGLPNRRAARRRIEQEFAHASQTGLPLAVAIIDIDFFKAINDRHGHPVGDRVLVEVAGALATVAGEERFIARLGGEEFVVVLPGQGREAVLAACEAMREGARVPGAEHPVTVSIGATACRPGDDVSSVYARADLALYRAKQAGRNRVEYLD